MPIPKNTALNYGTVLKELMYQAAGPLAVPELVDLMLARLPSSARRFGSVSASDPSREQISHIVTHDASHYSVQPVESTGYPDAFFDAVCRSGAAG